jgi:hypothetical protein
VCIVYNSINPQPRGFKKKRKVVVKKKERVPLDKAALKTEELVELGVLGKKVRFY